MTIRTIVNARRLAAFALAASMPFAFAGSAEAYQCKKLRVSAEAIGPNAATTLANAHLIWSNKVMNTLGLSWSVWNIASDKTQTCSFTGNNQYCVVRAKPCLYVVQ